METLLTKRVLAFEVEAVRRDFPILNRRIGKVPLIYLDNAATTQKPLEVIDRIDRFYRSGNANIHRGLHRLSEEATADYENARRKVAAFLGEVDAESIIFTRGATESINLVAASFLKPRLVRGQTILLTEMEHHANIVPWQLLAEEVGAKIEVVPVTDEGELDYGEAERLLSAQPALFALVQISNTLGTVNRVEELLAVARSAGVPVLLDGAQAVPHRQVDLRQLDPDFYVFSGHKVFGPTGIGVLYGKPEHLKEMRPYQGGGDMIDRVSFRGTTFAPPPARFEAGTPHICGGIGLGASIDYLGKMDREGAERHEARLLEGLEAGLDAIPGVRRLGHAAERVGAVSFVVDGIHPHDLSTFLDQAGIAVRAGHHCTQPLMERFKVPATTRASVSFYNTSEEVEQFLVQLEKTIEILR